MPVEQAAGADRRSVTHLEALGRLIAGLAPWIELPADSTRRGARARQLRRAGPPRHRPRRRSRVARFPELHARSAAAGRCRVSRAGRPPGAAHACATSSTRRRDGTWSPRSSRRDRSRRRSTTGCCFRRRSKRRLKSLGAGWDRMRVDYALRQHEQWYKGDGAYGDGPEFHWDYYNSFVIHPMLLDGRSMRARTRRRRGRRSRRRSTRRAQRYAAVQERLIGAGRQLSRDRPLARLPLRRLSPARRRRAPPAAARRRLPRAGSRRADRRHHAHARRAGHVRRGRLAADRLLRPPARRRRDLHLDRQPVSLRGRVSCRSACRRPTNSGRHRRSRGHRSARGAVSRSRSTTPCKTTREEETAENVSVRL